MGTGAGMGCGCGEYVRRGLGKERQRGRECKLRNSLFSQQILIECLLCTGNFLDAEDIAVKNYIKNPYLHGVYILIGRESQ